MRSAPPHGIDRPLYGDHHANEPMRWAAIRSLQRSRSRQETEAYTEDRYDVERNEALERTKSVPIVPRRTKDGAILVDWYYSDDKENPQNWTNIHRGLVTALICVSRTNAPWGLQRITQPNRLSSSSSTSVPKQLSKF